jgi:hypothetical protein
MLLCATLSRLSWLAFQHASMGQVSATWLAN